MLFPLFGKILEEKKDYCSIHLGIDNSTLDYEQTGNLNYLNDYIFSEIEKNRVSFGIGGYLEKRNIYQKGEHFSSHRNIHLAIDIWGAVDTPIYMPLDATIHSFKYNDLAYDYGATIIAKHQENGETFYTLYGHLSLNSLQNLEQGKKVKAGTCFASIGNWQENGGWPPHLHFQKIYDLQNMEGDYIGVCEEKDIDFYQKNCPNPISLIGIQEA